MNVYEMIETVRKRPGMFLGSPSISKMRAFIDGFCFAINQNGCQCALQHIIPPLCFEYFHDYVRIKLKSNYCNVGWCIDILEYVGNDEEKGLECFFELLDEYKKIKVVKYSKVLLTKNNIEFYNDFQRKIYNTHFNDDFFQYSRAYAYGIARYVYNITLSDFGNILVIRNDERILYKQHFLVEDELLQYVRDNFGDVLWENDVKTDFFDIR